MRETTEFMNMVSTNKHERCIIIKLRKGLSDRLFSLPETSVNKTKHIAYLKCHCKLANKFACSSLYIEMFAINVAQTYLAQ